MAKKETTETKEPIRIFVYGTLKKGHHLHDWMNGSTFVANDLLPGHSLVNLGWYPALLRVRDQEHMFKAQGEVYDMPPANYEKLKRMEEGAGYKTVDVVTKSGYNAKAFLFAEVNDGIASWQKDGDKAAVVVNPDDEIPF